MNYNKKAFLTISISLVLGFQHIGCSSDGVVVNKLPGRIIMSTPIASEEHKFGTGLAEFTPGKDKPVIILGSEYFRDPIYSPDKSKIYAVKNSSNLDEIIEYDKKTGKVTPLINNSDSSVYSDLDNVPGQNSISYLENKEKLYIYNLSSKEKRYITKVQGDYSWDLNGGSLLFSIKESEGRKVFRYNIKSDELVSMFNGSKPQISNSGKYMAYILRGSNNDILIVRELYGNSEWKYQTSRIFYFEFSPDDLYLAIEQEPRGYTKDQEMKVWGFKNNLKGTLIKVIKRYGDFDWK